MSPPLSEDTVVNRFPSWMVHPDDPFKCDLPHLEGSSANINDTVTIAPREKADSPRKKMVHRLDSAERVPPPNQTKIRRTCVGEERDSTDEAIEKAFEKRQLLTSKACGKIVQRLPLSLPDDLAFAIATVGSGLSRFCPSGFVSDGPIWNPALFAPPSPAPASPSCSDSDKREEPECSRHVPYEESASKPLRTIQDSKEDAPTALDVSNALENLSLRLSNGSPTSSLVNPYRRKSYGPRSVISSCANSDLSDGASLQSSTYLSAQENVEEDSISDAVVQVDNRDRLENGSFTFTSKFEDERTPRPSDYETGSTSFFPQPESDAGPRDKAKTHPRRGTTPVTESSASTATSDSVSRRPSIASSKTLRGNVVSGFVGHLGFMKTQKAKIDNAVEGITRVLRARMSGLWGKFSTGKDVNV